LKGLVFNIQRYSIHDGPGIRTLVFLKGCPLNCLWCCNPESQSTHQDIEFISSLCIHCGECISVCPNNAINPDLHADEISKISRADCNHCGDCVSICPSGALKIVGEWYSIDEAMNIILKDESYYRRSNGGVTISGGEPMLQFDFTFELAKRCFTQNLHTAIETCGVVDWKYYKLINPYTDLYLFDIKHINEDIHKRLTGLSNKKIMKNLRNLSEEGKRIILRIPLIPDCNVEEENLNLIAEMVSGLNIDEVHLMPFHQLGKSKYSHLGREYSLHYLSGLRATIEGQRIIQNAKDIMENSGHTVFIGG